MPSSTSNTLPPGWEAKIDKNSGRTYFVNHHDKSTSWDHPCNPKKSNSKVNGYPKQTGTEFIPLQDFSSKTRGSPLTVKPKSQETHLQSNSENTDEAVAKIAAMFPTVSDAHIRLLMKNSRYMKSIFPKADETMILEILSNHDNNIQKTSETLCELGFEKKDSLKISQQKYQMQIKSEEEINKEGPKSPAPIPKKKTAEEKEKMKSDLQNKHKNIPEQLITIALESVDFDEEKASSLLSGTAADISKTQEGKVVEFSEVDNQGIQKSVENTMPVSMSRQSLKSLLKSEKAEKEKVKIHRFLDSGNSGYKSNNLSNVMGPNPVLAKGNKENLLLEDYIKWQGPNPNICKGANAGLAKGPNISNKIQKRVESCGPNSDYRKGPNKNLVKGSIVNQMKATVSVIEESRGQ